MTRTNQRLDSWKAIAGYFGRTTRTVQRWERNEGLPVHRHFHSVRSSVYAYSNELELWHQSRAASDAPVVSEGPEFAAARLLA